MTIDRRHFLKTSATLASATAIGTPALAADPMKIGFVQMKTQVIGIVKIMMIVIGNQPEIRIENTGVYYPVLILKRSGINI